MDEFILETRGLTKEFKGFTAVSDVNLKVRRGTIHALIGPNGAGKTTVFNLVTKLKTARARRPFSIWSPNFCRQRPARFISRVRTSRMKRRR